MLQKKLNSRTEMNRINYDSKKVADSNDSIMISIDTLKNNKKNIDIIQKAFNDGAKVYIYGGVSTKEYTEFLNINELKDNINVNGENENIYIGYVRNGEKEQNDVTYDVIGYGKDQLEDGLSVYNLSLTNEKGENIKSTQEIYTRTILEDFYKIDDKKYN